jgi:hypothetical protein
VLSTGAFILTASISRSFALPVFTIKKILTKPQSFKSTNQQYFIFMDKKNKKHFKNYSKK